MIGETTRNAVIGKADRLNLEARTTASKKASSTPKIKLENNLLDWHHYLSKKQ